MIFQKEYWERKKIKKRRQPSHVVIREYVVPKIKEIQKNISLNREMKLLDAGAGNGFFSFYFDKICDTYAVDYSQQMLKMNPIEKKKQMDVNDLKFDDGFFDIVFCHALLHHVDSIDDVIREMKRVSKKYIVILEPNRTNPLMFLFSFIVREERKALKFSLKYLRKIVERNNLRILRSFSYGMSVPNKLPTFMLGLTKLFNFKIFFGMTNFIIAEKI